jgi:hypothetical protein
LRHKVACNAALAGMFCAHPSYVGGCVATLASQWTARAPTSVYSDAPPLNTDTDQDILCSSECGHVTICHQQVAQAVTNAEVAIQNLPDDDVPRFLLAHQRYLEAAALQCRCVVCAQHTLQEPDPPVWQGRMTRLNQTHGWCTATFLSITMPPALQTHLHGRA